MTTRARPYLGYASACLLFLFIYPQLQGLPRLIPINASQKLFDALAIAGPIFWFLRRSSPKASAMIGFVMGATLLVWLLRRRLHLDTSIFTSWEAAVPIAMASLVKSPDRDDIVATGHIISIGVFALGLSIIALLAPHRRLRASGDGVRTFLFGHRCIALGFANCEPLPIPERNRWLDSVFDVRGRRDGVCNRRLRA